MIIIHNIASIRVSSMTRNKIAKIIFSNWMNLNFIMFFPLLNVFFFIFFCCWCGKLRKLSLEKVLHLFFVVHSPSSFSRKKIWKIISFICHTVQCLCVVVFLERFPCWLFAIRQTFVRILFPQQSLECLNF